MIRKTLAIALVLVMTLSSFTFSLADDYDLEDKTLEELEQMLEDEQDKDNPNEDLIEELEDAIEDLQEEMEEEDENESDDTYAFLEDIDDLEELQDLLDQAIEDDDLKLAAKIQKRITHVERHEMKEAWESDKDELEALKDEAEEAYEEAKEAGELTDEELDELRQDFEDAKADLKEWIKGRKEQIQNQYTNAEKKALKEAEKAIRKGNPDDFVIPYDSIFSDDYVFKFDTPPVIRSGRTLIPVRAITEGFGCTVAWDGEEQEVTITRPDSEIEIVIELETGLVFVDGDEVEVDVPGSIMNNRTYVPLRFILETFGLKVNWDSDNEVIEIEDEDE